MRAGSVLLTGVKILAGRILFSFYTFVQVLTFLIFNFIALGFFHEKVVSSQIFASHGTFYLCSTQ